MLGSPFRKGLRDLMWPTLLWGVGIGLYGVIVLATLSQALGPIRDMIKNMGWVALIAGNLATPAAYVSYSLFTFLPALLAAFAITQVESWSSDEEEGRAELVVAMPFPRWRLLVARYLNIALALAGMLALIGLLVSVSAAMSNVSLDMGQVWLALAAAIPFGLAISAFGLLVATLLKRPGAAVPITTGVVVLMFFLDLFAPLLRLPDAVRSLSIFRLYGRPLSEGIQWGGIIALAVAALVLGAASLAGLQRRDIAR
jgi:ABC-2 type transport system permease protein